MVIYVEDNLNNQRLLERFLSKRNLEVRSYADPDEAYNAILEQKPDLVFMDIHLKTRKTGLDVVRQLRANGITVPIIALTAFAMIADRRQSLEAGCNDYLNKPYEMQQLLDLVDKHLPQEVNE